MTNPIKIKIIGSGGQGVKFLMITLGKIINNLSNKYVSIIFDYDAAVIGGDIGAEMVYSDKKITNPLIDKADIYIALVDKKNNIPVKKTLKLFGENNPEKVAIDKFNNKRLGNIIILGILIKLLNIDIHKINLEKIFPSQVYPNYIEAVHFGFNQEI